MADSALHIINDLAGIALIPAPVQVLSRKPELDDEIAGQILRLDLAALLMPCRMRAASSLPMMIRASEPPMK